MPHRVAKDCPLAAALAEHLRSSRDQVTAHWLERIAARVDLEKQRIFPTEDLLDHVPLLIDGVAAYLEEPAVEIGMDMPVVAKAMELGALRYAQGFDAYEILKEYEILGGILFHHLSHAVDEMPEPCEKSELLACGQRLFRAIAVIQQATTTHFLRLAHEQVREREEQLRAFNRAVSHEIKTMVGTVLGTGEVLREVPDMPEAERARFIDMITRNARAMQGTIANVLAIRSSVTDPRRQRHVRLPETVREAVRQVREAAQAAGLTVRVASDLPDVEVSVGAVELCLVNFLSNAIKYLDRSRAKPVAEISGRLETEEDGQAVVVVRVRDNGIGVPPHLRDQLFRRFFRAHETVTGAEGTGLGLSIVRDTVEALGGRAWAEFPAEGGSVFAFCLPARRAEDASARHAGGAP